MAAATSGTTITDGPGGSLQDGAAGFTSTSNLTIVRAGDIPIDRKSIGNYRNGASDGRPIQINACSARGIRRTRHAWSAR